jgi:hypothetical protein
MAYISSLQQKNQLNAGFNFLYLYYFVFLALSKSLDKLAFLELAEFL